MKQNQCNLMSIFLIFLFSSFPIAATNQQTVFGCTKKEFLREYTKSFALAAYLSTAFTMLYAFTDYMEGTNPNWSKRDYLKLALKLTSFFIGLDIGVYLAGKYSLHTLMLNNYDTEPDFMRTQPQAIGPCSCAIGTAALSSINFNPETVTA